MNPKRIDVVPPQSVAPLSVGLRDAARLLGVSDRWLWSQSQSGAVPCSSIGGRRLFRVAALEEWLRQNETGRPSNEEGVSE
jgi:hypothetical protein